MDTEHKNIDGDLEPEFEYLEVEVSRKENTQLFLKVPKGWTPKGQDYKLLGRAAKETTSDFDWDTTGWEHSVELEGHKVVGEEEASHFKVFDVTPHIKS